VLPSQNIDVPDITADALPDLTVTCPLRGGGSKIIKQGAGTLLLEAVNTNTGEMTIAEGTLQLGEFAKFSTTPRITVNAGATYDVSALGDFSYLEANQTLAGNGTVVGNIDSYGGTVAPGASVGTLTLTGKLMLEADSAITAELGDWSAAESDRIVAGTLEILSDDLGPTVVTIDGSLVSHFGESNTTLTLVQTTGGITGFGTSKFVIQTANFPGTGGWTIQQNGNNLELAYSAGNDPYLNWAATKGLTGANNGFDIDAEGDGVANGLEWILGGDPLAPDAAAILPAATATATTGLTLSFTREEASIGLATLTLEWNTGLEGTWSHSLPIGATSSSGPNGETVTIDDTATPDGVVINIPADNAVNGRIFARLRASQ
jgi:autotransporter-associated beta strand protein